MHTDSVRLGGSVPSKTSSKQLKNAAETQRKNPATQTWGDSATRLGEVKYQTQWKKINYAANAELDISTQHTKQDSVLIASNSAKTRYQEQATR